MSYFDAIQPRPELARAAFRRQFAADPREAKLLLATGAFKDPQGETPVLQCVRLATKRVHARERSHDYLPEEGDPAFVEAMNRLLFGESCTETFGERLRTAQTPGGTAALWLGGTLIRTLFPGSRIWVSHPTWSNHIKVFEQAGLEVHSYAYYDPLRRELLFEEMLDAIARVPNGDVIFLQAATHNPTGLDPTPEQWRRLRDEMRKRGQIPFFDVAFFGFVRGVREDLEGLSLFCETGGEMLVAASLSKSFSLYNERVGSLSVIGETAHGAASTFSHVQHLIRGSYSNPPLHGAAIIGEVLSDRWLRELWKESLRGIRRRIGDVRAQLARRLSEKGVTSDLSYLTREAGLFTRLDLEPTQIDRLRDEHAIYIGGGGQFNVTALPDIAVDRFCDLVAPLLG